MIGVPAALAALPRLVESGPPSAAGSAVVQGHSNSANASGADADFFALMFGLVVPSQPSITGAPSTPKKNKGQDTLAGAAPPTAAADDRGTVGNETPKIAAIVAGPAPDPQTVSLNADTTRPAPNLTTSATPRTNIDAEPATQPDSALIEAPKAGKSSFDAADVAVQPGNDGAILKHVSDHGLEQSVSERPVGRATDAAGPGSVATPSQANGVDAEAAGVPSVPWHSLAAGAISEAAAANQSQPDKSAETHLHKADNAAKAAGASSTTELVGSQRVAAARPTASLTDQVQQRVSANLDQLRTSGHAEIQINLHPPELGPVQLHLSLDAGNLSVRFLVQNDGAKTALDHQLESMRARFADMGLSLSQFDVRRDGGSNQEPLAQPEASTQAAQMGTKAAAPTQKRNVSIANWATAVDVMA